MPAHTEQRKVLLAGATGLVGGRILEALLADPGVTVVHALGRRPPPLDDPKIEFRRVDFDRLPELPRVDEVYLALGTTIGVAGSRAAFRAVDLEANLAVARAAATAGASRVGLVSAAGASAQSPLFYNRVKGELEDALEAMDLAALVIARPSLLLGNRVGLGQAPRTGEMLAMPLARVLAPVIPGTYRPVHARAVAVALVKTLPTATGLVTLASAGLSRIAGEQSPCDRQ